MSRQPIGVFDSGIGGLTVLKELLAQLPNEDFIYFGDTARVPYGNKSPHTVQRFSRENVRLLLDRDVKMVVVACNTATAEALPQLVTEFEVPIVGVIEPGARAAVQATRTRSIGVIGTLGTIRSGAYTAQIKRFELDARVIPLACPLFVPLVEEGWIDNDVAHLVVERYLNGYLGIGIDTLVLGCTHYPLLKPVIASVLGDKITLVDSAIETSREVNRVLQQHALASSEPGGRYRVILSDTSPTFAGIASRFLGQRVSEIEVLAEGIK